MDKSMKKIITVISLAIMFGFGLIPPFCGLNAMAMRILGIFIGTVSLWLTVSITWPSLVSLFALALSGLYPTGNDVLSASFGAWTAVFIIFSSAICYVLRQTGFLRRCAIRFATRPFAKRSPWLFFGMLFLAVIIIGSVLDPLSVFIVFVPIVESIFLELGYNKGDKVPKMLMLGTLAFASISTITTPISHPFPIVAMSVYTKLTGETIDFFRFSVIGFLTAFVLLILILLSFRFLIRPDVSKIKEINTDFMLKELTPMSKPEKISVIVFLVVIAIWMSPGIFKGTILANTGSMLGTTMPAVLGFALLCLIKVDGKPIADLDTTFNNGVPWSSYIIVATTVCLGGALTNSDVGITTALGAVVAPLFSAVPPFASVLVTAIVIILLTNFISNIVAVTLIANIVLPLVAAGAFGSTNLAAMTLVLGMGSCIALATPPSTAPAAVAVGTGWLDTTFMFRWGMLICAIAVIVITLFTYPVSCILL